MMFTDRLPETCSHEVELNWLLQGHARCLDLGHRRGGRENRAHQLSSHYGSVLLVLSPSEGPLS